MKDALVCDVDKYSDNHFRGLFMSLPTLIHDSVENLLFNGFAHSKTVSN